MKMLEQGRLAIAASLLAVILAAAGRAAQRPPISLGLTAAGAVCFLIALGALWGLAGGFQRMLDDLPGQPPKT